MCNDVAVNICINCSFFTFIVLLTVLLSWAEWLLTTREAGSYIISVVSVCLSDDNFRKPWHSKFIFAYPVYLQWIQVKFIYEGHRVKVKVTWAKRVENPHSSNSIGNISGSKNIEPWSLPVAWVFGYDGLNGVTVIFVTWPKVTTRNWMYAFAGERP